MDQLERCRPAAAAPPGRFGGSASHAVAAQVKNILVVILLVATILSGLLGRGGLGAAAVRRGDLDPFSRGRSARSA